MADQTYLFVARVPAAGIWDYQRFIAGVLPLVAQFDGRLDRRFSSDDATVEVFVVTFPDTNAFEQLRTSTHLADSASLLYRSGARFEVIPVAYNPITLAG